MQDPVPSPPFIAIGLVSAGALAYEILLTRIFAVVHWHHLVAIAISLALLGYGASGTFLALFGPHLKRVFPAAFIGNAVLFSISAVVCVTLAQRLPFDPQALTWEPRQILYLASTFLVLALPFFAAANCIGLALWQFRQDIPRLYGFDLMGAGAGALLVLLTLAYMHPRDALFVVFISGMLVALSAAHRLRWHLRGVAWLTLTLTIVQLLWLQPEVHPAAYKDLARALASYGAKIEAEISGIAGTITLVRNDQVPVRYAPGLSLQSAALPPRQSAVFLDGDSVGTLGDYSEADPSDAFFRDLVSALPYVLRPVTSVAVMQAGTGERVQQALAFGVARVAAVEPNPQLQALTCGREQAPDRAMCDPARVNWKIQSPRAFLAADRDRFDLISLAVEGDAAGLDALNINFDLTWQAFGSYLEHLTTGGMLMLEGTTRAPPRLSIRMLHGVRAALKARGVDDPGGHIAMIRGWQRFVLLASVRPLDPSDEQRVREFADSRGFDLVWLPHIRPQDANRYQQLAEPLFHRAAAELLSATPDQRGVSSRYRTEAPSDDRPFPALSTRWLEWRQALLHGDRAQLAQLDTGLLIGTLTLALAVVASIVLIALPLLWLDRQHQRAVARGERLRTLSYFGLLGIAFLFLELGWIQRLQLFLGHPVYATTAVLAAFLVFAGLGSMWSQRRADGTAWRRLALAVAAILLLSALYLSVLPGWLTRLAGLPIALRIAVVLLFLAPLAFAMGIPFPTGLRQLGNTSPGLIPWAWGINGCTSVISATAAPLLAIEIGFDGLMLLAVAAYLCLPLFRLGRRQAAPG